MCHPPPFRALYFFLRYFSDEQAGDYERLLTSFSCSMWFCLTQSRELWLGTFFSSRVLSCRISFCYHSLKISSSNISFLCFSSKSPPLLYPSAAFLARPPLIYSSAGVLTLCLVYHILALKASSSDISFYCLSTARRR